MLKLSQRDFWYHSSMAVPALLAVVAASIFCVLALPTLGHNLASAAQLNNDQRGAISQHCATTKQSLRTLQRTDARTRSYLGSAYENLLSNFITPLNLRLINSGQPNTNLTNLHSKIIDTRKTFISEYTSYSQSLEDLVSTDCQGNPDEFYDKLLIVRKKRAELSSITTDLRNLFSEHVTDARLLRNSMSAEA